MILNNRVPTHPGEILRDYWEDLIMTQADFANRLGVSFQAVNEILNCKRGISPEMAVRLSKFLGTTPEFWLALQNSYDIYKVISNDKKSDEMNKIKKYGG